MRLSLSKVFFLVLFHIFLTTTLLPLVGPLRGSFSEIVKVAKDLGYTEPDPRNDLNGMNVARKVNLQRRLLGRMHVYLYLIVIGYFLWSFSRFGY